MIRQGLNFRLGDFAHDTECPDPVSMTVPGMSVPLDELINRLVAGRSVPIMGDPVYEGHLPVPDVRLMDKVEREEYSKKVRSYIGEYRKQMIDQEVRKDKDRIVELEKQLSAVQAQILAVGAQSKEEL